MKLPTVVQLLDATFCVMAGLVALGLIGILLVLVVTVFKTLWLVIFK